MSLLQEIIDEEGCFFKNVDKRGGLTVLKEKFLTEAAEDSKGKTPEEASVIGWNKCCEYDRFHTRYYDSFHTYSNNHPSVNY